MTYTGCGRGDYSISQEKNAVKETEKAEVEKEYEETFSDNFEIDNSMKKIRIVQNANDVQDTKVFVGNSEVKMDRISTDAGYSMTKIKTLDCTGDGKDEIVMILQGGASGAVNEIQVLTQKDDAWMEIPLPEELWDMDFVTFDKKDEKVSVTVKATNTKKELSFDSAQDGEEEFGIQYRLCKMKKNEIVIIYKVYRGELNNLIGKIEQKISFDKEFNKFSYGETSFSFSDEM
jgi:hypothetical protein